MSSNNLRKEKDCLNCGHTVEDRYCPHCGQENIELKEDALHMLSHTIADYFHFEHKFFGTLKPLLLKPGFLTKEYVAGKRMSYLHPVKIYIFISIVFFIFILGGEKADKKNKVIEESNTTKTEKSTDTAAFDDISELKEVLRYIPIEKTVKDSIIRQAENDIKTKGSTKVDFNKKISERNFLKKAKPKEETVEEYEKNQRALPKEKRDGFLENYFKKKNIEFNHYEDPGKEFKKSILHNVPKMMFVLLPLFALILKLVYINKKKYYYEHLIYSFHVHSALFLSVLICMFLTWATGFVFNISNWLIFACMIYMTWYIYKSLRVFYGGRKWGTILRLFLLFLLYNILFSFCAILLIGVSFILV